MSVWTEVLRSGRPTMIKPISPGNLEQHSVGVGMVVVGLDLTFGSMGNVFEQTT